MLAVEYMPQRTVVAVAVLIDICRILFAAGGVQWQACSYCRAQASGLLDSRVPNLGVLLVGSSDFKFWFSILAIIRRLKV